LHKVTTEEAALVKQVTPSHSDVSGYYQQDRG